MKLTNRLLISLVAAFAMHPASATTVLAYYSRDAILIGADSKFVDASGDAFFHCWVITS